MNTRDSATISLSRHIGTSCLYGCVITATGFVRLWSSFLAAFNTAATVEASWNVMVHAQKTDFVFRAKRTSPFKSAGGRQFSRLLAAEVCASAVLMLDTPCSEVVWRVLATHCIRQFPLHFLSLRHRVPSHYNWSLPNKQTDWQTNTTLFCTRHYGLCVSNTNLKTWDVKRTALFCVITQRVVVIYYRRFGTTYRRWER